MRPILRFSFLFTGLVFLTRSNAQKVLPEFTVKELTKGKIQVSWNNPYPSCIQLAIQRSTDSSKNYRTIFSSQSPELPANGFVDNKPIIGIRSYYRIFYVLAGGAYYFSKPVLVEPAPVLQPPVTEKPALKTEPVPVIEKPKEKPVPEPKKEKDMVTVFLKKTALFRFTRTEYQHFRDSVNTKTKDALHKINDHAIEWRPANTGNKKELITLYLPDESLREFTKTAYKKFKDSVHAKTKDSLLVIDEWHVQLRAFVPKPKEYISIYRNDILIRQVEAAVYKKIKDSITGRTKDTLFTVDKTRSDIHPFIPKLKNSVNIYKNNVLVMQIASAGYQKFKDSISKKTKDTLFAINRSRSDIHPFVIKPKEHIDIYRNDSLLMQVETGLYGKFKDSLANKTKDTLFSVNNKRAVIHPFVPKYVWKPSVYVFTNAKGYVTIALPLVKQHKYHIVFFDEDGSELFRIKTIKETELVLDKTNFLHAGWFGFELFEDDKLKEKSKFLLSKD